VLDVLLKPPSIHGWNKNESDGREEFNRIQSSLNFGYMIPLIGFSWTSKVLYPEAIAPQEFGLPRRLLIIPTPNSSEGCSEG